MTADSLSSLLHDFRNLFVEKAEPSTLPKFSVSEVPDSKDIQSKPRPLRARLKMYPDVTTPFLLQLLDEDDGESPSVTEAIRKVLSLISLV